MTIIVPSKMILKFLTNVKRIYGNFWKSDHGFLEYYLKLDGYYYCEKRKCMFCVIRVRNKRTTEVMPVNEVINDREYLKELHPVDACVIGILANNERNGIIDNNVSGWRNMSRSKEYNCPIKSKSILRISRKYTDQNNSEMIVLHSSVLNKEMEISAVELCKNQALLYALDSLQAISVGYDASENYARSLM